MFPSCLKSMTRHAERAEVISPPPRDVPAAWLQDIKEAPMTKCISDGSDQRRVHPPPPPRAPPKPVAPQPAGAVPEAGSRLCRSGCGRAVQPGLTRCMKPYDTCCRGCASGGVTRHDRNCGGALPVSSLRVSRTGDVVNPKQWFIKVLDTEGGLETYAASVFAQASGGSDVLTKGQLRTAMSEHLLSPVGRTLKVRDSVLNQYMTHFSGGRGDTLDQGGFHKLCQFALEGRRKEWFPLRLPAKTHTFVRKNPAAVRTVYEFGKKLGEGGFGAVHAVVHKVSGERRVCKTIQKRRGRGGMSMEEIIMEIETMAKLDHPNVIKVYEYFEGAECVMQIMEQCEGGELQDQIDRVFRKGRPMYGERFICDVMKQILRALAFMHGERCVHKDLKPQNIMLVGDASAPAGCSVKLIDFGLAELFEWDQTVSSSLGGTLLFMAPEVLEGRSSMKADLWSTGVILYNLITGRYPFMGTWPLPRGKTVSWWEAECKRKIRNDPVPLISSTAVSAACKDLLGRMLDKDANSRPDAAECLEHPWFQQFHDAPQKLSVGITQCLDAYSSQPPLKQAIFLLIAHLWSAPALQELRALFTHFDVENRGSIPLGSLYGVLQRSGMQAVQAVRTLHALDNDDSGSISWTEFIAAALCVSVGRSERLVGAAFAVLDRDSDGKIDAADFEEVFAQGAVRETWRAELGAECLKIASAGPYTRAQFLAYVGGGMQVAAGDTFLAVTA